MASYFDLYWFCIMYNYHNVLKNTFYSFLQNIVLYAYMYLNVLLHETFFILLLYISLCVRMHFTSILDILWKIENFCC